MSERELLTLGETARRLGISRHTLRRCIADFGWNLYGNPIKPQERLLDWAEVSTSAEPKKLVVAS